LKTNEVEGTRAVLRHYRMSAYKARQVLDMIRGQDVDRAQEMLAATPREAARVVAKVLASAAANARHNDGLDPGELYVAACFADEGATAKRWRPRARGRATRIRKRSCHITVIVSRLPEERLARRRAVAAQAQATRSRRVAASRRARATAPATEEAVTDETVTTDETVIDETVTEEEAAEETEAAETGETGAGGEVEADDEAEADAGDEDAAEAGGDDGAEGHAEEED
jgi:large subunit ribosomal protein L22